MSRRCRIIVYSILIGIAAGVLALVIKLLFFSGLFVPTLELIGAEHIEINMNETYQDPGARSVYRFMDNSEHLHVESTVDTSRLGTYQVIYTLDNADKQVIRTVEVIDGKAPDLRLKGAAQLKLFIGDQYEEPGYTAYDNCDGDITDMVKSDSRVNFNQAGTYEIVYTVQDSHGNEASCTRSVQILENPLNVRLAYDHDMFDNTAFEWWFNKSADHARNTAAKDADWLKTYGAYYIGPDEKVIYLTFDAGYENGNTAAILEALKKHNAPAAFFLVGNYLETSPDLVRQMAADGHIVGNHTFHHPDMAKISSKETFEKELTALETLYQEVTGQPMKKYYRPPQGRYSESNLQMACDMGYTTFFWSLAYVDWYEDKQPSREEAFEKLLGRIHPGAIVLLHSTSKTNAEILDELLTRWKEMGYRFGSLNEIV